MTMQNCHKDMNPPNLCYKIHKTSPLIRQATALFKKNVVGKADIGCQILQRANRLAPYRQPTEGDIFDGVLVIEARKQYGVGEGLGETAIGDFYVANLPHTTTFCNCKVHQTTLPVGVVALDANIREGDVFKQCPISAIEREGSVTLYDVIILEENIRHTGRLGLGAHLERRLSCEEHTTTHGDTLQIFVQPKIVGGLYRYVVVGTVGKAVLYQHVGRGVGVEAVGVGYGGVVYNLYITNLDIVGVVDVGVPRRWVAEYHPLDCHVVRVAYANQVGRLALGTKHSTATIDDPTPANRNILGIIHQNHTAEGHPLAIVGVVLLVVYVVGLQAAAIGGVVVATLRALDNSSIGQIDMSVTAYAECASGIYSARKDKCATRRRGLVECALQVGGLKTLARDLVGVECCSIPLWSLFGPIGQ